MPDDVHVACNVLKNWLWALPTEDRLLHDFPPDLKTDESFKATLEHIPPSRRKAILFFLSFASEVIKHSKQNKMTIKNFSICVAQGLFKDPDLTDPGVMQLAKAQQELMEKLMLWYAKGFAKSLNNDTGLTESDAEEWIDPQIIPEVTK